MGPRNGEGRPRTLHADQGRLYADLAVLEIRTRAVSGPPFIMPNGKIEDGGAGENRTHDRGFADLGLTTWLPRHSICKPKRKAPRGRGSRNLERETGFEPATSTLARSHSTAELLPLGHYEYK